MSEQHGRTYDPDCEVLANKFLYRYEEATIKDRQELAQQIQDTIETYLTRFMPELQFKLEKIPQ